MEDLKEKFFRIYSELLEPLRKEIVVVVDEKTYSWNSAYFELKNNTSLGEKILKNMKELGLI